KEIKVMPKREQLLARGAAATAAFTLLLGAAACSEGEGGQSGDGVVTVIGTWGGAEEEAFLQLAAPFERRPGIDLQLPGTRDLHPVLTAGVASGVLPDVAGLPGRGQMREFAQRGALVPLDDVLDIETYRAETSPAFVDLGTVDGQVYGVFIKAAVKGLIWYNPAHYDGTEPQTWHGRGAIAGEQGEGAPAAGAAGRPR